MTPLRERLDKNHRQDDALDDDLGGTRQSAAREPPGIGAARVIVPREADSEAESQAHPDLGAERRARRLRPRRRDKGGQGPMRPEGSGPEGARGG